MKNKVLLISEQDFVLSLNASHTMRPGKYKLLLINYQLRINRLGILYRSMKAL